MAPNRQSPREIYARNLQALLEKSGMSVPVVAAKAKVDRKTVNNQLNMRNDLRAEQAHAVAAVFGYGVWDLLNPNFDPSGVGHRASEKMEKLGPPSRWPFSFDRGRYDQLSPGEKIKAEGALLGAIVDIEGGHDGAAKMKSGGRK